MGTSRGASDQTNFANFRGVASRLCVKAREGQARTMRWIPYSSYWFSLSDCKLPEPRWLRSGARGRHRRRSHLGPILYNLSLRRNLNSLSL